MSTTTTTAEEQIKKLYDSQLASTKEQLTQAYDQNISALDTQKKENAVRTQKNLVRTAVEAQQAQKNYAELQNAYGLSSGALAQARLAQDNQLQADLTALRAARQTADDGIESQRALLGKEYTSAIAKAQADNDLQRAQALYAEAKEQEEALTRRQEDAAKLMASAGDFSLYATLYGLTPAQVEALTRAYGGTGYSGSGGSSGGSSTGDAADTPQTPQISGGSTGSLTGSATGSTAPQSIQQIIDNMVKDTVQNVLDNQTVIDYRTVASEAKSAKNAGKSSSEIAAYIRSAAASGYITQNQAQSLLKQYA